MAKTQATRAALRRWHRWTATAAAVLLGWVAITGTVLAIEFYLGAPRPHNSADAATAIAGAFEARLSEAVASAAGTLDTPAETVSIAEYQKPAGDNAYEVQLDVHAAEAGLAGDAVVLFRDHAPATFEIRSGRATPGPAAPTAPAGPTPAQLRRHNLLIALHTGTIVGLPGRLLDVVAGISLVFLSLSGLWMYVDMYQQRRLAGRGPRLFWPR